MNRSHLDITDTQSPEFLAKQAAAEARFQAFERLYRDWHAARAACIDPDLPNYDDALDARLDAWTDSERLLLTTPAPSPYGVMRKFEVLDFMVQTEIVDGRSADNRLMLAVAAIKADVMRFGLREPDWAGVR
jgi:hypothetical protein